ncbi:unnamed protein product [Sphagnum balticum]
MAQRELEVTIISAQNLNDVRTFEKMALYAVAWVYSDMKLSTPIDPKGSVNPTWNTLLKLIVAQWSLEQPNATLNVDIYSYGSFSNKHVGSCSVPLSHFQEGADTKKFMSFLVCTPSGHTQGILHLSLKLGDINQPPAIPGRFAPVAQTVEPNNSMAYPAGHPNGYNQAGANQYPQYPPQLSQSYHYVAPPAPYYQPPVQYAFPPPPRRTGLFRGLATNLLSVVRAVFYVAELDALIGGDGFAGGACGA